MHQNLVLSLLRFTVQHLVGKTSTHGTLISCLVTNTVGALPLRHLIFNPLRPPQPPHRTSSASESPLHKSTETFNTESHIAPNMGGATESESAMGNVTRLVSDFLASRVHATHSGRSDVSFDGKGVRWVYIAPPCYRRVSQRTPMKNELCPSRIYRPNCREVCT